VKLPQSLPAVNAAVAQTMPVLAAWKKPQSLNPKNPKSPKNPGLAAETPGQSPHLKIAQ
jgi:hypothetical protein